MSRAHFFTQSHEDRHGSPLKRKFLHFDEILITGCIESCQNDNFQCSQWWKFRQTDLHKCCTMRNIVLRRELSGVRTTTVCIRASIRTTYGCFSWYRKPAEVCYLHGCFIIRHNIVLYRTAIYRESLILLYICVPMWVYAYIYAYPCIYMYVSVCVMTYILHEVRILSRTGNSVHIIWKVPNVCISCISASLFEFYLIFFFYHVWFLFLSLLLLFLSCFRFPIWSWSFTFQV